MLYAAKREHIKQNTGPVCKFHFHFFQTQLFKCAIMPLCKKPFYRGLTFNKLIALLMFI